MKCVVIHNDTQEEGTEPLYSRSLRKKGPAEISAGPFWVTEPVEVTSLYTELWTLLCLLSNDQLSVFGGFTLRLMCYLLD